MTTIAIDFGTSNTVVAWLAPDTQAPQILHLGPLARRFANPWGETVSVVPSLVYVPETPDNPLVLGEPVRSQRWAYRAPERTFVGFKRGLAADFSPPPRQIAGRTYDNAAIAQQFLTGLWAEILAQGIEPSQLILTVPVGAFERYLGLLRQWSQRLAVADVRFVDESTAAALRYAPVNIQINVQSIVLVIDWGGGTLDLSLVRLPVAIGSNSPAQVLAKADAYLGGEDIDRAIIEEYFNTQAQNLAAVTTVEPLSRAQLLELAERLKIQLSQTEAARETWLDETTFQAHELHLSRDRLREILETAGFLAQLRDSLDEVLQLAQGQGVSKAEIEQVILVGGTCLMPMIQDVVIAYFGRSRVKVAHPFTAVAEGALAVAQLIAVQDYLQHSYAIQLWDPGLQDYTYFTLFAKGTYYPCLRPEPLTLQVAQDGESEVRLNVGEIAEHLPREVTYDALGRLTSRQRSATAAYHALQRHNRDICIARLNPPGVAGQDRIRVDFEVNAQRMLLATVTDLLTRQVLVDREAIAQLT
ncbi:MAG: Hsp70 family protein [Cyanobacteria bacterium P01_G01_bin.54]